MTDEGRSVDAEGGFISDILSIPCLKSTALVSCATGAALGLHVLVNRRNRKRAVDVGVLAFSGSGILSWSLCRVAARRQKSAEKQLVVERFKELKQAQDELKQKQARQVED